MMSSSATRADPSRGQLRSAWAAFWCGLLFAIVNLYWTLGGTFALETVGGRLARAVVERNPVMMFVLAVTVLVKLGGALFALALVQPWGSVFPRWLLLVCGWSGTAVLVGYGGVLVGAAAALEIGIIPAPPEVDWTALRGHLYVWDMWFLVWGVLLGSAMVGFTRRR
ncbi:Protein of unknown function [Actinopolyspora alba]|uniref:DUF3995 domain-containing protein n=1 Tax=Actinopolyspora alba TaxID=673379 RepID=A0A1I1TNV8_9ACTN|nr:DUF3995 domain-containing protein [Actinopolyspora alba]SFD60189.1 Protein of unknown function [Actinopolyspora alba]